MGDPKVDCSLICRICMQSRKLTPIFGVAADAYPSPIDYSINIKRYADVELWKNDGLPQNICYGCIALLNSITYFKNMCEGSYKKLMDKYRPQYGYSTQYNSEKPPSECVLVKSEPFDSESLNRPTTEPDNLQSNMKTSAKTSNQVELEIDTRKIFLKVEDSEEKYNIEYDNSSCDGDENDSNIVTSDILLETVPVKTPKLSPSSVEIIKKIKNREKFIQNRMKVKELMRIRERARHKKMFEHRQRKELLEDIKKEKALKDMIVQVNANKPKKGQDKVDKFKSSFRLVKENARVQGPTGEKVTNLLQCIECNTVMRENSARCHYNLHLGHKYICEHCGHGFHIQKEMERHCMAKHGKKKTYGCNLCSYETPYKPEFVVHLRVHTGERPFACDICGRTFYKKQVLTRHVALHSNLRPHQCLYCQKSFSRLGEMKSHINSVHHRRYVYKCTECDVTYAKIATVRKHLVAIHRVPRDRQERVPRIALNCMATNFTVA